jgi:hypothetical protein
MVDSLAPQVNHNQLLLRYRSCILPNVQYQSIPRLQQIAGVGSFTVLCWVEGIVVFFTMDCAIL